MKTVVKGLLSIEFIYCGCNCGKTRPRFDRYGEHKFIKGHQHKGSNNGNWKHGIFIDKYGYKWVYVENHPYSNRKNQVKEHRLVMEKHLGRYLRKDEDVHHKNIDNLSQWENKHDNRIENLQLVSRSEHMIIHIKERRKKDIDNRECYICHTKDVKMRLIKDKKGIVRELTNWFQDPIKKGKWDCPKHYQQRLRLLRRLKKQNKI